MNMIKINIKKGFLFLILIFLLTVSTNVVVANENVTDIIEESVPNNFISSQYQENLTYEDISNDKLEIDNVDENRLSYSEYHIDVECPDYIELKKPTHIRVYVFDSRGDPVRGGYVSIMNGKCNENVVKGIADLTFTAGEIGENSERVVYRSPNNEKAYGYFSYKSVVKPIFNLPTATGDIGYDVCCVPEWNYIADAYGEDITSFGDIIIKRKGNVVNPDGDLYVHPPQKPGTYYYSFIFKSNDHNYLSGKTVLKIVYKHKLKISIGVKYNSKNKKTKITALFKDFKTGHKIKKGKCIFTINGKSYKVSLKKGKAIKYIKLKKGKIYAGKIKFVRDKNCWGNSRIFKINYKKIIYKKKPTATTYTKKTTPKKKSSGTYEFNVPQSHASVDVRVYTGSSYHTYSTQTDWLGNGEVYITETSGILHKVRLYVYFYSNGFKTAVYEGMSVYLK